ncbi:hypothetical protein [Nocardioides yefusunii]|uniref:Uncharacterized protein n=1 Tax=Nocardioides yefusunii TaxID=2500546 RepID=A0ABW1R117_9ACTN|nr:hypothetical protein [Nocardioides yefusunii]
MALESGPGEVCAGVDGWELVLVGPVVDGVVRLTRDHGSVDVDLRDADEFAAMLGTATLARVDPGPPHHREVVLFHADAQVIAVVRSDVDLREPARPLAAFAAAPFAPHIGVPELAAEVERLALTIYTRAWLATALREGADLLLEPAAPPEHGDSPYVRCWVAEGRLFTKVFPVPVGPDWAAFEDTDHALTAVDLDVADPYAVNDSGQDTADVLTSVALAAAEAALTWDGGALGVVATLDASAAPGGDLGPGTTSGETLTVDSPRSLVAFLEEWLTTPAAHEPGATVGGTSGLALIALQHPHLAIRLDASATADGVRFWLDRWYGSPHLALVPDPAQSPADVRREGPRFVVAVGQWLHTLASCALTATLTEAAPAGLRDWAVNTPAPRWLGAEPGRTDYTRPHWFRATLPRSTAILDDLVVYLPDATLAARTLRHLRVTWTCGEHRLELADLDVHLEIAASSHDVASGAAHTVPGLSEPFLARLSTQQYDALRNRAVALVERATWEALDPAHPHLGIHFDDRVDVVRTWRELLELGLHSEAARLFAEVLVEAEERDVDEHLDFGRTDAGVVELRWDGRAVAVAERDAPATAVLPGGAVTDDLRATAVRLLDACS